MYEFYVKKEDSKGNVTFEKINSDEITIRGKTIREINEILSALELEKITGIEVTMSNFQKYIDLFEKEQEEITKKMIDNFEIFKGE